MHVLRVASRTASAVESEDFLRAVLGVFDRKHSKLAEQALRYAQSQSSLDLQRVMWRRLQSSVVKVQFETCKRPGERFLDHWMLYGPPFCVSDPVELPVLTDPPHLRAYLRDRVERWVDSFNVLCPGTDVMLEAGVAFLEATRKDRVGESLARARGHAERAERLVKSRLYQKTAFFVGRSDTPGAITKPKSARYYAKALMEACADDLSRQFPRALLCEHVAESSEGRAVTLSRAGYEESVLAHILGFSLDMMREGENVQTGASTEGQEP